MRGVLLGSKGGGAAVLTVGEPNDSIEGRRPQKLAQDGRRSPPVVTHLRKLLPTSMGKPNLVGRESAAAVGGGLGQDEFIARGADVACRVAIHYAPVFARRGAGHETAREVIGDYNAGVTVGLGSAAWPVKVEQGYAYTPFHGTTVTPSSRASSKRHTLRASFLS